MLSGNSVHALNEKEDVMPPIVKEKSNYPFFIFGCPRSGSSLLSRMLNAHPRLAVPFESHVLSMFYPLLPYYGDLRKAEVLEQLVCDILSTDVMRDWVPPVNKNNVLSLVRVNNLGGIMDALMRSWAQSQHKQRWGDKTPWHVQYWPQILQYFPQTQFIHIMRDGRDVAISLFRARFGPKTAYGAAKQWDKYIQEIECLKRAVSEQNFYQIRYEDLLQDPEATLSAICDFLHEDYSPHMLEFYKNPNLYKTDHTNMNNLAKPLLHQNTMKWRTEMTDRDLYVFEAVAQSTLRQQRYEVVCKNPSLSQFEMLSSRFLVGPAKKMLALLRNRKGQIDALIRWRIMARLMTVDQVLRTFRAS
ncbi:MAG: sulfotransferase [Nitrospirales bacterium]|nr:MAG: sulfotransferase [Nitrospirales bacterium]